MVLITHCKVLESYIIKASFIKIPSTVQVEQLKIKQEDLSFQWQYGYQGVYFR